MWIAAAVGLGIWGWYQMDYRTRSRVAAILWGGLLYAAAAGAVVTLLSGGTIIPPAESRSLQLGDPGGLLGDGVAARVLD